MILSFLQWLLREVLIAILQETAHVVAARIVKTVKA
jgi:hypothetical protein